MQLAPFGRRALVAWVGFVCRWSWPILLLALAVSGLSLHFTVTTLGINTSTTDMLSAELPFRKNSAALDQAFPQFVDNLTVVVEAASVPIVELLTLKTSDAGLVGNHDESHAAKS